MVAGDGPPTDGRRLILLSAVNPRYRVYADPMTIAPENRRASWQESMRTSLVAQVVASPGGDTDIDLAVHARAHRRSPSPPPKTWRWPSKRSGARTETVGAMDAEGTRPGHPAVPRRHAGQPQRIARPDPARDGQGPLGCLRGVPWTSCSPPRHYARVAPAKLKAVKHRGVLPLLTAVSEIRHAKGVVGVISPWNYLLTLARCRMPSRPCWRVTASCQAGLADGLHSAVGGPAVA